MAVLLFLSGFAARSKLPDGKLIRLLSNLTYSVYLFHNWTWDLITSYVEKAGISILPLRLQVLVVLFVLCYLLHITIETYGLAAGRRALSFYRSREKKQPSMAAPTN